MDDYSNDHEDEEEKDNQSLNSANFGFKHKPNFGMKALGYAEPNQSKFEFDKNIVYNF